MSEGVPAASLWGTVSELPFTTLLPPGSPRPTDPFPALPSRLPSESTPCSYRVTKQNQRADVCPGTEPPRDPRPTQDRSLRFTPRQKACVLHPHSHLPPRAPAGAGRGAERAAGAAPRGGSGAGRRGGRLGPAGGDSAAAPLRSGAAAGRRRSAAPAGGRRRLLHARCAGGRGACAGREGPAALRASPGASWISYFLIAFFFFFSHFITIFSLTTVFLLLLFFLLLVFLYYFLSAISPFCHLFSLFITYFPH